MIIHSRQDVKSQATVRKTVPSVISFKKRPRIRPQPTKIKKLLFFALELQIKVYTGYNTVGQEMTSKDLLTKASIVLLAFLLPLGCKKTPTTAVIDVPGQRIAVSCNPDAAGADTIVTVTVAIKENEQEIRVFGLEATFDTQMFQFQEVAKNGLTADWAAVDGNEISQGKLRVGGFVGGGTSIAKNSTGSLVDLKFKVTGQSYGNGQQSQICINQYSDDIASYQPNPACTTFSLKK
jgi:hypothetical protein